MSNPAIPDTLRFAEIENRLVLLDENSVPVMWLDSEEQKEFYTLLLTSGRDSATL